MRYMPSRNSAQSGGGQPGNRGEGDPVNGYPFGSTTTGYIDYRDIEANGPFYPGTTRQRYQDDPNARSLHTPGSDRRSQLDQWIADGNPTGIDHPRSPSRARGDMPLEGVVSPEEFARRDAQIAQRRADTMGKLQGMQAFQSNFGGMDLNDPAVQRQIRSDPAKYAEWKRQLSVAKLGLPEDWRLSGTGITPRSRNGQYWYRPPGAQGPNDPGLPGPTPPGVAQSAPQGGGVRRGATPQNAPMSEGVPPSQNPMMQGYGAGQVYGGQGGQFGSAGGNPNFVAPGMYNRMEYGGGYNPGQSKSGMGQDPYGMGASTGQGGLGDWLSQQQGGGQMMSMEGRGGGFLPPGFGGGGRQPIDPGSYNPQPFNPYQPRQFNPGQSKSGMGQSPYGGGPQMSTGGDMGMDAYNPNYMAPGMNNRMEYGNSSMQGGNMMGYGQNPYMPQGGGMQAGYAPFDQGQFSMPYDQYSGMGYW